MKAEAAAPFGAGNSLPGKPRRLAGFSLTELMVVIAIIAIMAAMLMPAISKAKLQTTAAACFGNQKKLAGAFHMYAQDNGDRIIQMADYATGETVNPAGGFWQGPTSGPGWPNASVALAAVKGGLLNSNGLYFYCSELAAYHCPGDRRFLRSPSVDNPQGWGYDSYARTQNLGGEPYDNFWGAGDTFSKLSAIYVPGNTFAMVEDSDWRGYNIGTWVVNWMGTRGFEWQDPPAIWHRNVSSVGFADGHSELHKWLDSSIVQAGRVAAEGLGQFTWRGPLDGPDYQFVYKGYQFPGHP